MTKNTKNLPSIVSQCILKCEILAPLVCWLPPSLVFGSAAASEKTHYQPSTGAMYLNLTISISPCVFSLLAIDPMSDHVADKNLVGGCNPSEKYESHLEL